MQRARQYANRAYHWLTHAAGRLSRRYYFEDYKRVYPDRLAYNRLGQRREARTSDINNYLNHRKFYEFAAQFVRGKTVADVGCGSGYGCEILKQHGALRLCGCDVSRSAIRFADERFGSIAEFTLQGITNLCRYEDATFDVTISSEVLEHVKEYCMEEKAVSELRRVTRPGGLIVVGTPNSELLGAHGFSFAEISQLFSSQFEEFRIFENALLPFGEHRAAWLQRQTEGNTGVVVSQRLNLAETVLPDGAAAEMKTGLPPGRYAFGDVEINTTLLHNSHSWIVVAIKPFAPE